MGVRKAIVLGGYGLIGSACMRALAEAGFDVVGVGRSQRSATFANPAADWAIRDIPTITADEWRELLTGADVVVNAAGALQDGARDDLEAIHVTTISRLVEAVNGMPVRVVHISAAGVSYTASTAFFRTKARGDDILSSGADDWVILRPTLVLSHEAYGGTALLRAVAALPLVLPVVFPNAKVQTVHIDDVASAVVAAASGQVATRTIAELTEHDAHSFPELVSAVRRWQGWTPPVWRPAVPGFVLSLLGRGADLLGHLGWRSPLRTTALRALADGIRGDPTTWEKAGGTPCRSLADTLSRMPATRQERLFARSYFVLPLAIGTLALFWCVSGLVTLLAPSGALSVLADRGMPMWAAGVTAIGGAVADIALGLAILWRRWTRPAAIGMLALSGAYLVGGLVVAPDLWADPLGPMVKVFPGMTLAALVWLLMEDR